MIKREFQSVLAAAILAIGVGSAVTANASVVIAATRVVYNAKDREATVKLSNEGNFPALTQVWIDKGDPTIAPTAADVPFTVTPPVARIDPGKGQTLRLFYTGDASLPKDKESVFWLNVLEIPPKPTGEQADRNTLQVAYRSRIKLFFRPTGLTGTASEAPQKLQWRQVSEDSSAVEIGNPTPYHVSIAHFEVQGPGKAAKFEEGGMVGPGERKVFKMKGKIDGANAKVHYQAVSDYGGEIKGDALISQ
ncbi:fimbria/pilus periplasmic chaperone [Cupriavidus sp. NPDC089707]|uniref:fimbria/pilus periplasmic chaperone n=1 Tax=Cupriavidus sp. NPDC089707 TaxID=3363963 RepID=UPI0037FF1F5B